MSVPVLTANSPVAGSIAWTAFNLSYNGVAYAIAAGNSSHVYTWWPYNGGLGGALQTSDVQPTLTTDDLLLFINKNGIPINVQNVGLVDGDLIVNGTLVAAALIAGTISTREMGVDSVNAAAILAGSVATSELAASAVTADKISAGAVTTDKLTVASLVPDTVPNGTFEDLDSGGTIIGWEADPDVNAASVLAPYTTAPINGARSLGLTTINAGSAGVRSKYLFPVRAGDTWVMGVSAGSVANVTGTVLRCYWLDKTGVKLVAPNDKTDIALGGLTNVPAAYTGQVTVPAGAAYMRPAVASLAASAATTVVADDVVAMRLVVSAYIADGAISTNKLAAGSIVAGKIAAGAIDGMTITGALIRTAASGARWEMSSTNADRLVGYSGDAAEIAAGLLQIMGAGTGIGQLKMSSPDMGHGNAAIICWSANSMGFGLHGTAEIDLIVGASGSVTVDGALGVAGDVTVAGSSVSRGKRSEAHLMVNNAQNVTTAVLTAITGTVSTDNMAGVVGANLAVTVPVVNGRFYMVFAPLHLFSSVAGDNVQGTVVASTGTLNAYTPQLAVPAAGRAIPAVVIGWYYAAATGNVTFTAQMARASGTGNVNAAAGSSIAVIDVG